MGPEKTHSISVEDTHMTLSSEVPENEKKEVTVVGKISDTASMYYCHVCGKTFGRETNFRIHMNTHPNPCPHCGKAFKQKAGLQAHISSVHEGQKFQCPLCEYKATHKSSLQVHIKSIHEGQRLQCPYCKLKFSRNFVKEHIKTIHEGAMFPCP